MSSTKAMMNEFCFRPKTNETMSNVRTESTLNKPGLKDGDIALKLRECFTTIDDPTLRPG